MTPGNHEVYQNFSFLNYRLRMPDYAQTANQYFSFDVGQIHFLAIDMDFYDNYTLNQTAMMDWITNDLEMAVQQRDTVPWIIVLTHRPIYCSYSALIDPVNKRCYSFYSQRLIWDEIFYKYRVDMVLQAHVHSYER